MVKYIGPSGTSMAGKVLSAEQTVTLDTIPRYASITSFSSTGQTLNTASFKWSTNVNCSKIEYKIGSGSYVNLNQTGTSGTFTVSGLSPSTNYKFKLRVTRSDSGLKTESSEVSVTTQAIATITTASDFNIGTSPTIKFSNPSGKAIAVYMEMDSGNTNISNGVYTVTGRTEYQFTNVNNSAIYSSIPNANSKSIRYVIRTTEGSNNYYSSVTKTAYVVNSNPTVGSFTYADTNSTVTAITQNNQRIVRNQSTLTFTIGSATAKNSATISNYEVTFNGTTLARTTAGTISFGTINLSYGGSAVLKVTDSRGNSTTSSINVTIDDWVAPTGTVSLRRKNNYEAETYLTVDGTYLSVNAKNTMTIKYQYKKTSESNYNTATTINDNTQKTLSLDNTFAWDFKITITDKFTTTTYTATLNIGMPILFVDAMTQNVGINCFPTSGDGKFQVSGNAKISGNITTTGTINSNKTTSTHINGNKGINVVINNTASDGYNILARQKSKNGVFCVGSYNQGYHVYYTADSVISAGTNSITHDCILLNESGQTKVKALYVNGKSLLDLTYPVGSVYMSVNSTNPANLFGGTWEQLKDRVLVGAGNTYSVNATGGSNTRNISHSHGSNSSRNGTLTAAIGSTNSNSGALGFKHTNDISVTQGGSATYTVTGDASDGGTFNHWTQVWGTTASGGNTSLDIRQPYLAVYMWKRTA